MIEYAQGGLIEGPFSFQSAGCVIHIHRDECLVRAADVKAGRWVCSRPGHPTATSHCREEPQ